MVISCYLDINIKDVIPPELNKALDYAQQNGLAVVLGMDSTHTAQALVTKLIKGGTN